MKNFFVIGFILFFSTLLRGQKITQAEFEQILNSTHEIINAIQFSNFEQLNKKLQIDKLQNVNDLKNILNNPDISLNNKNKSTYSVPHFKTTNVSNQLLLIIPAFKILPKRSGEDFERGEYYFVLKTIVEYDFHKKLVVFKDTDLITIEYKIQNWWLSQFENYVKETKIIYNEYGFIPPPPPSPPKNLK
ncbi:hypothetical protein [Sinomicrobium weinanense]|uniref:Uncharacterized protein n=1 Tax=Sinomicrobium weinanense TaxID=2842200 RepID=A0A926Q1L3_9FLAO|nr:hypothetical protein [Sinomicrobium weinanense]MBC9795847.1 hypothetical protein [Sinomicrobium weinanense]MBU3125367.1 hypothetical protein [Sinomicrobium weinanense]